MKDLFMTVLIVIFRLISSIPRKIQFRFAGMLGRLISFFVPRRTGVVKKNLSWCFSNAGASYVDCLVQDTMRFAGQSFFDTGVAWFWTDERIKQSIDYEMRGLDAFLQQQKESDKGILLLGKHSQHLELDGRLIGQHVTAYGVGRGSDSAVINRLMTHGRRKAAVDMASKTNPRQFLRWLKDGHTVVYFPDQDYGVKRSIMASLFDVPAVFTTAPFTLHKLSGCLLYFYDSFYEGEKLVIVIEPLVLPDANAEVFTQGLAAFIESKIAAHPAEYLWTHRRFKSTKGKASYAQ